MELVNSFKKYLIATVPNIVFKSTTEAEKYETMEIRSNGDRYVDACHGTDVFESYASESFTETNLNRIGIYDKEMIKEIQSDKYLIPEVLRSKLIGIKRKEIINNYIEKNSYYRALNGLPDIGADYIYINPSTLTSYGYYKDSQDDYDNGIMDELTPLHELPPNVIEVMESSGFLDELYNEYNSPSYHAEYIKHLGTRKIEILDARVAGHYELLYVPKVENANRFHKDFTNYYEEARQYFLNQIYNYHYNAEYEFYESYIGFFILVMGIQRTINSMFEVMVERDFYDIETCRMFLTAYGAPFIESFTFNQQLNLVKNLNILLMEKCTSRVLYDILSLLEFDRYDLTKYLLVKQHKMADVSDYGDLQPIFVYRTVLTDDGSIIYELDKSAIYDYYFVGVDIKEDNVKLAELGDVNTKEYELLTEADVYWLEDDDLVQKLQDDEINYVETKYTNVTLTLRVYQLMFEHVYLQKMICDKGRETSKIMVSLALISDSPVSILEMEVLLICLLCKHTGMSPDLLISPSKNLAVLGFNFDADFDLIREDILNNPRLYSEKLIKYVKDASFRTVSDINETYGNVKALYDLLVEGMENTHSERVYHAYKKLYTSLMVTDVHNEIFALPDGSIPESYLDWLKAYNTTLYEYMEGITQEEAVDKINYITTKMSTWFTNTEYLSYLNPVDLKVINDLIKILKWFKSYTMDIRDFDIIYLFDSKYHNLMKMLGRMWFYVRATIRETDIGYRDWVASFVKWVKITENKNKLLECVRMSASITVKDFDKLMHDAIKSMIVTLTPKDYMASDYMDTFVLTVERMLIDEISSKMHDSIRFIR